ncbi:hypothetical protein [Fodinicola acaciae]|uniref:hypothetical protein n=1 Tax=Fodinicola acaciae TaxID=2681555 RepID=UPI0013D0C196|nr:hypothetical protein [Fodinicola acaciae]
MRVGDAAARWVVAIRRQDTEAGDVSQTTVITVFGIIIALGVMAKIALWVAENLHLLPIGGG